MGMSSPRRCAKSNEKLDFCQESTPQLSDLPKPDLWLRFLIFRDKLSHRIEYDLELLIIPLLESIELETKIFVGHDHLPQTDETSHDLDIHLNGSWTAKNARKHGNTLFRENEGSISFSSMSQT